jgi:hypothetical protein
MNAEEFLKSKGKNKSPYGEVIWNFDTASNEWLADLLEEYAKLKTNMAKDLKFQREQVKKLRSLDKFAYEEASIYTILFDLLEGNGLDEVFMMLHNVATDLEQRKELEGKFDDAKNWEWP